MAEYYNERSLLQGSTVPQFDVGALTKAGALVQAALGGVREREFEDAKIAREAERYKREGERYNREQLLNQRADQEWNREVGLRDARKNIAAEFTANPYATKFGSGKETVELDKQVLDYVNNGGEINEDLAKRLQARYEEALPFKEDAANAVASRMIALGEDPIKAKQEADVLTSGQLWSKADKQAKLDAQQQMTQKYYDEIAKANLEAAKMNVDVGKANLNADTDLTKLKWQAGIGGTGSGGSTGATGGIGGNWYDAQQTIEKMDFGGIDTRTVAKPFLETAQALEYSPNQAVLALKQGADLGLIDKTFDVEKSKAFLQKMAPIQTGTGGTRLDMAVSGSQFMPQFAPKQIAGYDPKGFLEGSRSVLPELFSGDPNKITEETKVNNPVTSTNTRGNTLADRNFNPGNIKFDPNTKWEGGSKGEKGFVKFDTPELGARALAKVATNNIGTPINAFITKYAPPYENDTSNYIAGVVKSLGKKPTDKIEQSDILPLMKVISKIEGGSFTDEQLKAGYDLVDKYPVSDVKFKSEVDKKVLNPQTTDDRLSNDVLQAAKEDYLASGGGLLDDIRIKSNLARDGKLSEQDAEKAYEQIKGDVASNNNVAYRNYLIAKRTGSYQGKSADDWYDELDSKNKGAVWAPAASIIAALPPAAMLFGGGVGSTLPTITSAGARTVSGGSKASILNDMFVPQIQRLMSQPYTAEVKEGLLNAVSKLPQAEKIQVIKYIQRMEQLGK